MKVVIGILVSASLLLANSSFKEDKEYTCLNTTIIKNGVKKEVPFEKSFDSPFVFTIKGKELRSTDNDVFTFNSENKDEDIIEYVNENFTLFLIKHKEISFVPKGSNQTQYIFKCRNK